MALEVKLLDLIDIELESSFLVLARNMGQKALAKTWGSLILGGDDPILVDTGASHPEIMQRLGMTGWISEEQQMENQLARYGVKPKDVRYILHTHNHIDHAGQDDKFPMTTTVCMQRKELEHSVSGLMTEQYPGRVREAPRRPAPHPRRAATARSRALRADRAGARRSPRARRRPHRGVDEHPRRDGGRRRLHLR